MSTQTPFRIDVFSIFPQLVDNYCNESLLGRARQELIVDLRCHDLRDYGDESRRIDDSLYGGGAGMLFRPEPVFAAVEAIKPQRPLFLLSPGGAKFDQNMANQLSKTQGFSLLCGRYEGVDHRIVEHLIDGEISLGDFVLSGGEVAACLVIEATTRLLPGAMGNEDSPVGESFGVSRMLEEPHYTRPADFRGWEVPQVLRSGDHAQIERWRRAQALHRTVQFRPDLIERRGGLSNVEKKLLEEFPCVPYPERPL